MTCVSRAAPLPRRTDAEPEWELGRQLRHPSWRQGFRESFGVTGKPVDVLRSAEAPGCRRTTPKFEWPLGLGSAYVRPYG